MTKTPAFYAGYEAKTSEIQSLGWVAARDEFNRVYPPGQKWTGSSEGLGYSYGEFQALSDTLEANRHTLRASA